MIKKNIFKKKYISYSNIFLIIIFIFLLFIVILIFLFKNNKYFEIPNFTLPFYYISEDKGGIKIENLNKKSLNEKLINKHDVINDPILQFSIQLFASNNYRLIKNKYNEFSNIELNYNSKNKKLDYEDLYIAFFDNKLDNQYLLLYKNFVNRDSALEYCNKYLKKLNNCIIVNAQNLD